MHVKKQKKRKNIYKSSRFSFFLNSIVSTDIKDDDEAYITRTTFLPLSFPCHCLSSIVCETIQEGKGVAGIREEMPSPPGTRPKRGNMNLFFFFSEEEKQKTSVSLLRFGEKRKWLHTIYRSIEKKSKIDTNIRGGGSMRQSLYYVYIRGGTKEKQREDSPYPLSDISHVFLFPTRPFLFSEGGTDTLTCFLD